MLATTPTHPSDYMSIRARARDSSMSPSCRASLLHHTPQRPQNQRSHSLDSPMLTPSPLRRQPLFSQGANGDEDDSDDNDIFLQSPFASPSHRYLYGGAKVPTPIPTDDDEGGIFLASSAAAQPISSTSFPSSAHRISTPSKPVQRPLKPSNAAFGLGLKRKSTPLGGHGGDYSPLRQRITTPLGVSSTQNAGESSSPVFDRLAPLPAPQFTARTPQSKAEAEVHLKKHTESMTRLRICDLDVSDEEDGDVLFSNPSKSAGAAKKKQHLFKGKGKSTSLGRTLGASLLAIARKGKGKEDEVAEAVSPGGHVIKRRARSRPVSQELLESVHSTPSPPQVDVNARVKASATQRQTGPISFPSLNEMRSRAASCSPATPSTPSEPGSPLPRRRLNANSTTNVQSRPSLFSNMPPPLPTAEAESYFPSRAPMARLTSSATLFFGPAIPSPQSSSTHVNERDRSRSRSRTRGGNASPAKAGLKVNTNVPAIRPQMVSRPSLASRHSYAGPNSGGRSGSPLPWGQSLRDRSESPSPRSSPHGGFSDGAETHKFDDDDEDMFFDGPKDSSFVFSVTEGTPSPRKPSGSGGLTKKYKPRDSGVVMSDDEGTSMGSINPGIFSPARGVGHDFLNVMPRASTSVNSVSSDLDTELVTPGFGPGEGSGWPEAVVVGGFGFDDVRDQGEAAVGGNVDVDAFILRTLAAAKAPQGRRGSEGGFGGGKKAPGTPVKKVKTSHLGANGDRPWQSAVAAKVGFGFDFDGPKPKAAPRKSMPAAFPPRGADQDTDSEGEEDSPSLRRDARYEGLGIGKPTNAAAPSGGPFSKTRWLMRRSSSGIFSSGSDMSIGNTPTKHTPGWNAAPSRIPTHTQVKKALNITERSVSGSSSSSASTLHSPSARRGLIVTDTLVQPPLRPQVSPVQQAGESAGRTGPGRFEQDFVEVEEIGSGEFGKVMKVHHKNGREGEVFAVKKSKRFEGVRHRLRLREEVDTLQHLSQVATITRQGQHPNVLAYIDSWEQDEALYIQTELCDLGNFARFLWEYGRVFPRLDEARVWKIIVDLSNGLEFIHNAGVIHLDLKPANIFVTNEGRFKIGDFGMASLWPRPHYKAIGSFEGGGAFEREGDKVYLAPEVLQGKYGKAADIFSLGITLLETASNIVVPDQGDAWHQLRQEDFSQVDLDESPELFTLIKSMMRTDPNHRVDMPSICAHPVISRARSAMERTFTQATESGSSVFTASPLAGVSDTFLSEILARPTTSNWDAMDLSP